MTHQKQKLVVIGNGMAGARVIEEILKRNRDFFSITLFGAEPYGTYNRIFLSNVLNGTQKAVDTIMNPLVWYQENAITLHTGLKAIKIDRQKKMVLGMPVKKGRVPYDRAATGLPDENLVSVIAKPVTAEEQDQYLKKWIGVYSWEIIREEMLNLADKHLTKDEILKYLSNPVRLEFLTALAVKSKFPNVKVIPNYPVDDEGIPTSTAGGVGNTGDIECYENVNGILIEVTMSEGRTQTMMEVWPISRHLQEFRKKSKNSMCYFVAPSIFNDSAKQIEYVKQTENLLILPKTIEDFLTHIENSAVLYSTM